MNELHDFIIVGSGAGGATAAKALSSAGRKVLLLERGRSLKPGQASSAYNILSSGVEVWLASCAGGTTMVTMGNAVRSGYDFRLSEFFKEAERELGVSPVPKSHMGPATKALLACSKEWTAMPKAIDFPRCKNCGHCAHGCPSGSKWDATFYLRDAVKNGCTLATESPVRRVLVEGKRATGVETLDGKTLKAKEIILAAGAVETPRILMRSGLLQEGEGLFVDTYITLGGLRKGIGLNKELNMALLLKREGYIISPHYSSFLIPNLSNIGITAQPQDILGLMVKIKDAPLGKIRQSDIVKGLSNEDVELLESGRKEASELLIRAGVEEKTIVSTHPRGAHPGGTCSGLVNEDYMTETDSLYIADASVIPGPFGLPPMLTVIALSKAVSSILLGRA